MYAKTAWGPFVSNTNWTKIEVVQNVALRTITGTHHLTRISVIHNSTNMNTIRKECERATKIFEYKTSISEFIHLQNLKAQTKPRV